MLINIVLQTIFSIFRGLRVYFHYFLGVEGNPKISMVSQNYIMKKFAINGPRMVRNWLRLSILREFNRIVADFKSR